MVCKKCGEQNSKDNNYCSKCGFKLINGIGKRGFASMDKTKRSQIARSGGVAAHKLGRAHQFTKAEATAAGKKGGRKKKTRN